jgi:hypothetical protein
VHRGDLVLDLRAALDQPAAPRDLAAQDARRFVGDPHPREEIGGQHLGEHPSVDLVGLDLSRA